MRRRYRVATRPQERRERCTRLAAVLASLACAAALVFVVSRLPRAAFRPSYWLAKLPAPAFLRVERVSTAGLPTAPQALVDAALAPRAGRIWLPGAATWTERELLERFPFLEAASSTRDWRGRSVTFYAILQTPVARVTRGGLPSAWLGESGAVFEAPEGTYPPMALPEVDLGESGDTRLPALPDFLAAASRGLPAKPTRVVRVEGGWSIETADGTKLEWGTLDWTQEKLTRLSQVLGDAGRRFGSGLTADLRYFEDGKILVRPARVDPAVAMRARN